MDSSKTGSLTPQILPSELAAPAPCSTPTETQSCVDAEEIDWHHAFKLLSATIGKQFLSSDTLFLTARQLCHEAGDEAALEFAIHCGLNRSKLTHDFMG